MKVISFSDIQKLQISPKTCFDWVSRQIEEKGSTILPPKISMKPADGVFCNVMPCILSTDGMERGGVKVVSRYPARTPSLDSKLLLFNSENGEFLALMDADWITAMRTGAVAAHSIALLAKSDFSTIAVLGLGNTARAALLVLAQIMPERDFRVKLLCYKGQEELFRQRFAAYPRLHFEFVRETESLVRGSDVVISAATYLTEDLCPDECFDEGVLVVPIHTRGFGNCDLFFDKVFADDLGHVHHFRYFDRFRSFAEVSDVVRGRAPGRESDRERILAYNIGLAIHDVYFSAKIYEMLRDDLSLQQIDLKAPEEKFWV